MTVRSLKILVRYRSMLLVAWVGLAVVLNLAAPSWQIERSPPPVSAWSHYEDATALRNLDNAFPGTGSDNTVFVVVEAPSATSDATRAYVATLTGRLRGDTRTVRVVTDMAANPLTAPTAVSEDRRATFFQVWLTGALGTAEGSASFAATERAVHTVPTPPSTRVYLGGPAANFPAQIAGADRFTSVATIAFLAACAVLVLARARSVRTSCAVASIAVLASAIALPLQTLCAPTSPRLADLWLALAFAVGTSVESTLMVINAFRRASRSSGDPDQAAARSYRKVARSVAGSTAGVALILIAVPWADIPGVGSTTFAAGVSAVMASALSLTVTPGWAAHLSREPLRIPRRSRMATLGLCRFIYCRPRQTLTALASIAVGIVLLSAAAPATMHSSVQPPQARGQASAGDTVTGRHFNDARLYPETVVLIGHRDLRNAGGLIAIDQVTRQLMTAPGVHLVQSPSAPAGTPWPEATLAHQLGDLNRQLQSDGISASPLTTAITNLPSSLDQVDLSVQLLQQNLGRASSALGPLNRSFGSLQSSVADFNQSATTLSSYAAPLRQWTNGFSDCRSDVLCSGALKVLEPLDTVLGGVSQLTASANGLSVGVSTATESAASAVRTIAEVKGTMAQLRKTADELADTVRKVGPQLTQVSTFINLMSDDLSNSGAGGFYLPQKVIDDPSYDGVRKRLFSADGRSVRLSVYSQNTTSQGQLAGTLETLAKGATKFGPLADSTVHVVGAESAAATLKLRWHNDFRGALLYCLAFLSIGSLIALRSIGAAIAAACFAMAGYAVGMTVCVFAYSRVLGVQMDWAAPLIAMVIVAAVVGHATCQAASRLRERTAATDHPRVIDSGKALIAAVLLWGLVNAATSPPTSTLGEVAAVVLTSLVVSAVAMQATLVALVALLTGHRFRRGVHQRLSVC